jgi:urea transport system permease protein
MRVLRDPFIALVCILGAVFASAAPAQAGTYEDALVRFTTDSYEDTGAAIDAVATSGNPLAATVLGALLDRRLRYSAEAKKTYYADRTDKLFDAATGEAVAGAPPADLAEVRVNNRLRRGIEAALGGLTLPSPIRKRYEAAQA